MSQKLITQEQVLKALNIESFRNLSKEKIRYVALGDSISEGYNNRYNFAYAGKMNENKVISGTS